MAFGKHFLRETAGSPERASFLHLSCLGGQSQMELKNCKNHSNKPMRVTALKQTWISRKFRIQNIDGTLIQTVEMTKMK